MILQISVYFVLCDVQSGWTCVGIVAAFIPAGYNACGSDVKARINKTERNTVEFKPNSSHALTLLCLCCPSVNSHDVIIQSIY